LDKHVVPDLCSNRTAADIPVLHIEKRFTQRYHVIRQDLTQQSGNI
jgi:hypothetical protein